MGTFTNLNYHLVFSTKGRVPLIQGDFATRLHGYLATTVHDLGGIADTVGGTPDHVHLLIRWCPSISVSKLLQDIKSHSSGWIHKTFPEAEDFAWQEGFGAFTVSESGCARVRQYIRSQEDHHRTRDFKEEFVAFLKKHRIQYDERYIWR